MTTKQTLCLIDGSGFIFRAYHALPPLSRSDGTPVNAVLGFTNMLLKIAEDPAADYLAVIFDKARKTFRQDLYPDYKAHRPPAPDDLVPQFNIIREATQALNIPMVEMANYEADDIIATYAKQATDQGLAVNIISSDKDLMQLIGPDVWMYDAMKNKQIKEPQVFDKFGVTPDRVRDVQALIGDSSDNVPGASGIGPKTAAQLIETFGDLLSVLDQAHTIKQPKRRETLINERAQIEMSYKLVTLCNDVPLDDYPLLNFRRQAIDPEVLVPFLRTQGFKALLKRFESSHPHLTDTPAHPRAADRPCVDIKTDDDLNALNYTTWPEASIHYTFQGTRDSQRIDHLWITTPDTTYALIWPSTTLDLLDDPTDNPLSTQALYPWLQGLLAHTACRKIFYDYKAFLKLLPTSFNWSTAMTAIDDVRLLSYVLGAGKHAHDWDTILAHHLPDRADEPYENGAYHGATLSALYADLAPQLTTQKLSTLYEIIEKPLIPVLTHMERAGVGLDCPFLHKLDNKLKQTLAELETQITTEAGLTFKVGSPKQLGEVLFDHMGLPGGKKGKSGAYKTDSDVLDGLAADGVTIAKLVLHWRRLAKLSSTYTSALPKLYNTKTNRLHTSFGHTVTATGRLSSLEPNLQNIPIRHDDGRKIRQAFIAPPGHQLVSIDYSQIELRLLAVFADDPVLKNAFRQDQDIHKLTASQIFGIPLDQVTPDQRSEAKTINFGIIYGMSPFGLATQLGIEKNKAKDLIDRYFAQYPSIQSYMDRTIDFARSHGYVRTLWGRQCHVPFINDKNGARRQFAERAAINAPLQGSNADMIKRAMSLIHPLLSNYRAKMILQVHDELLFEIPTDQDTKAAEAFAACMTTISDLDIPLKTTIGLGKNWDEAH
jgi:DNA polymerase-1